MEVEGKLPSTNNSSRELSPNRPHEDHDVVGFHSIQEIVELRFFSISVNF